MDATGTDPAVAAVRQLEALADNLNGRGFGAQVIHDGDLAGVAVAHRLVPQLSESIFAAPSDDGGWWFWWSWGDPLAQITAVETAAFKIAYVLTPHTQAEQATTP